jgi:glycine oxidase
MKAAGPSVAVVGGGIVGATIAYELISRGAEVTLYEASDRLGSGVYRLAMGGIRPFSDDHIRTDLVDLSLYTADNYSTWLRRLAETSEVDVECIDGGLLYVCFDEGSKKKISDIGSAFDPSKGVLTELDCQQLRSVEPQISQSALGAFHIHREPLIKRQRPLDLWLICVSPALGVIFRPCFDH